ncbi:hypothetical protein SLS62_002470 [Diatrype stigma]|uniref:protein-ribulosamine 3-kinase n=1 Tax=Diatrype stigma TaxID=117547 RepID=A0AAN9UXU5_9PEZI
MEDISDHEVAAAFRVAVEENRRIAAEKDGSVIDHRWVKESPVPKRLIQYIDQGVIDRIHPSGKSNWARTAKIEATDETGKATPFFIKVHQFEHGKNMVSSEFQSMQALYRVMPELVAEPIAWGSYVAEPDAHFFLCRFCALTGEIPSLRDDDDDFPRLIAELHKRGVSPTGRFGMPYATYSGRNPLYFPPSDSWEECFAKGLAAIFDMEADTHREVDDDGELRELREGIMTRVIPRLLHPLETEGRALTPRLVHGDLWDGNASVEVKAGGGGSQPRIFDGVCFYAHNEYELAPWWAPRHKMTGAYIAEYVRHFPVAEPVEDFEYRGLLYRLWAFPLLISRGSSIGPDTFRIC